MHEITGIDHRTLGKIKNRETRYVRLETEKAILSISFDVHCDKALIDATRTKQLITMLTTRHDMGFTKAEIAKRIGKKFTRTLEIARTDKVTARSAMDIQRLWNDAI